MSPSHKCHSKQNFLHWQLLFILHLLVSFAIHHASSCHISNMRPACQRNWSTQAMMGGESTLTVWWPLTIQVPGTDTALRRRERFNHFEKVKVVVRVIAMECRTGAWGWRRVFSLYLWGSKSVCSIPAAICELRSLFQSIEGTLGIPKIPPNTITKYHKVPQATQVSPNVFGTLIIFLMSLVCVKIGPQKNQAMPIH